MERINQIINDYELDSYIGTFEGEDFLIVSSWNEHDKINEVLGHDLSDDIHDNWGFDDEYTTCSRCGNIVKTSPDSYSWVPDFVVLEYELVCNDCLEIEEYIDFIANNPHHANTIYSDAELEEIGFIKLNDDDYEDGWYGTNDDPQEIYDNYSSKYQEIIFSVTSQGQFSTEFAAYGRHEIDGE